MPGHACTSAYQQNMYLDTYMGGLHHSVTDRFVFLLPLCMKV